VTTPALQMRGGGVVSKGRTTNNRNFKQKGGGTYVQWGHIGKGGRDHFAKVVLPSVGERQERASPSLGKEPEVYWNFFKHA